MHHFWHYTNLGAHTRRNMRTETEALSAVCSHTHSLKQAAKHLKSFLYVHCRRGVLAVLSHTANSISIAKTTTVPTTTFSSHLISLSSVAALTLTIASHSLAHTVTRLVCVCICFVIFHKQSTHLRTDFSSGTFFLNERKNRCCWARPFFGSFRFVHTSKRECVCLCAYACVYACVHGFFPFQFFAFQFHIKYFFCWFASNPYHLATCGSDFFLLLFLTSMVSTYWSEFRLT